ncbi:F-box/LRR-repeat protein 7 [Porphyridium purpureum]|uniref:F-box/LRR-repeat protein 7 n=1 Tax=Porphyridium purpureum TaxID=35688 RepID=A0A5J4Z3Y8_PORPP|nr:F-box/LRR-repeat protein 7 [Porphyridium purpureum]|eukprot:POR6897..scf295_1
MEPVAVASRAAPALDKLPADVLAKCVTLASDMDVMEIYRLAAVSQSFREVARSHAFPDVRDLEFSFPRMRQKLDVFRTEARTVLSQCSGVETLSFRRNEWLADDELLAYIGEHLPKLRSLDLARCRLVRGTGLRALRLVPLQHLSLSGCAPSAVEQIFERAWRTNRLLGTDSQEDSESMLQSTGENGEATPDVLRERRRQKQNRMLFPQLKSLNVSYMANVDDKYMAMLAKYALNLQHLSVRGCENVSMRGVHRLVRSVPTVESVDVSFCPQLDVQLLIETFRCQPVHSSCLIFPLDDWTPSGLCMFRSTHPNFEKLTFIL